MTDTPELKVVSEVPVVQAPVTVSAEPPKEKLQDMDILQLELAKQKRLTSVAEAKTALAQSETAEMNYRYIVLSLYRKYGLDETDALTENGEILRGGAKAAAQSKGK